MKIIISINQKFMEYSPKKLITFIKENSKYTEGIEISIDTNNNDHLAYLEELAFQCKKHHFHFQIHGNSSLSMDKQIEFIHLIEKIADNLGYPISIVLHSIPSSSIEESFRLTTEYLNELTGKINNTKIILSLENLNDTQTEDRLNKNDITPIVANNENLYLTYDIGHEIADYSGTTDLNEIMVPLISNVHIHTSNQHYADGFDHKPILKDDKNWNQILKAILFLKKNHYHGSIVFEYDLYACYGNSLEEKIKSYCDSIDFVAERIK